MTVKYFVYLYTPYLRDVLHGTKCALPRHSVYRNQLLLASKLLLLFGLAHVLSTKYAHVAIVSDHTLKLRYRLIPSQNCYNLLFTQIYTPVYLWVTCCANVCSFCSF